MQSVNIQSNVNININININSIYAYLGGSFDPVHVGHVHLALSVQQSLHHLQDNLLNRLPISVQLLPNARSPFKQTTTAPQHRLAMLQLACANTALGICEQEIWQPPPVYSIDTVQALRKSHPHASLIFILGADSAASLPKWRQGIELLDWVHLWVFARGDVQSAEQLQQAWLASADTACHSLQAALTNKIECLMQRPCGRILFDNRDMSAIANISSSQIRQALGKDEPTQNSQHNQHSQIAQAKQLSSQVTIPLQNNLPQLSQSVLAYIDKHQLYSR